MRITNEQKILALQMTLDELLIIQSNETLLRGLCMLLSVNISRVTGINVYKFPSLRKVIPKFQKVCKKFGGNTDKLYYWSIDLSPIKGRRTYRNDPYMGRIATVNYLIERPKRNRTFLGRIRNFFIL